MKYIHIISGIIVGLAVTSCKLDYNPTDAIANSTLTEDDYQYLLTGVYDGAQQFSMGLQNVQDDVAADNLNSRSWCTDIDNNTCTGTSYNINGWWNQLYYRIQLANNLVNLLEAKTSQTTQDMETEAQARLIRAWLYQRVVTFWGDAPLVKNSDEAEGCSRAPEADIWKFIKEDLEYAVAHAPAYSSSKYASDIASKALLARTLLIASAGIQDKEKAKQLAEEVIADGRFVLSDNFEDVFHKKTSKEIILAWENNSSDSGSPGWFLRSNLVNNYNSANGAGSAGYGDLGRYEFPVDLALWKAFEEGDTRKAGSVRHLTYQGKETYDVTKFPSYNGDDPYPVARIAEMYLVSAEAQGYPDGLIRLNELRAKRGLPALTTSEVNNEDEFIARIMQERRVEFIAEGFRWYDLRRWFRSGEAGKQAVLALRKYQAGEATGSRPTASEHMNISEDGHELLWPISTSARDNNPNLTQNPGY